MLRIIYAAIALLIVSLVPPMSVLADDDEDQNFTPITTCGVIINEPGNYRVVNDLLNCSEPLLFGILRNGISIFGNDVTLDLGGHTIRCAEIQPADGVSIGVFLEGWTSPDTGEEFGSRVSIRNGVIENCGAGVFSVRAPDARFEGLTIRDGGTGIDIAGGVDNTVRNNHVYGMLDNGIIAREFFGALPIGHRITKNLIHDVGEFGISAFTSTDIQIRCNRADRNLNGIIVSPDSTGVDVLRNVTNGNQLFGVAYYGVDFADFVIEPVSSGNKIKKNTALGNGVSDLAETSVDVSVDPVTFGVVPGAECLNTWRGNTYVSELAPFGCIAPSRPIDDDDDDDGCAPELDDDDDEDDDDDD